MLLHKQGMIRSAFWTQPPQRTLVSAYQAICRLQASGQPEPAPLTSFYHIISADEDTTMRSIVQITNGVTGIVDKVQTLLVYWEKKYKHMWDQDKDAYIRYAAISSAGALVLWCSRAAGL